jgi:hypothetical protein
MFKLDKNISQIKSLAEATNNSEYWQTKSITERLAAGIYLIKTSCRIDKFPPMEKHICSTRRLSDK